MRFKLASATSDVGQDAGSGPDRALPPSDRAVSRVSELHEAGSGPAKALPDRLTATRLVMEPRSGSGPVREL